MLLRRMKMDGRIKNLILSKGYGFIEGENGQSYFFHRSDLNGNWDYLCKDWADPEIKRIVVYFEPKATDRGPRASNVNLIQGV